MAFVQILGCVLKNRALDVFDEFIKEFRNCGEICDFNAIKDGILECFTDRRLDFVNWNTLHRRRLRSGETIRNYYLDLRKLNRQLKNPLGNFLNLFISGLPEVMKLHVLFAYPVDITQAVNIASEYISVHEHFELSDAGKIK